MTPLHQCELEFKPITPEPLRYTLGERFQRFHDNNPSVYKNLVWLAREFRSRSFNYNRKIGIKMLYEVLRWNFYIEIDHGEEDVSLPNEFTAPYARLIMLQEPDLQDAFNTKTSVVD